MKFKHKKLEPYRYIEDIGSGAQGKVVKVKDDSGREVYALKILKDEEDSDMFKGEIEALKLLNHRNVVRIYDASAKREEGEAFILMDYMKNGNIKNYLNENETVSVYHKLLMIQDVAKGLQYTHNEGHLHRDIKPANIFVTDDGGGAYACLGDFGIAKKIEGDVTETGGLKASYLYCPLEVLSGNEKQNEQTDIYGLGISMYEILTGNHPQKDRNFTNYVQSMSNNVPYIKPSSYDLLLDEKIDKICLKSIHKDKNKRYKTLEELLDDLRICLKKYSEEVRGNKKNSEKSEIRESNEETKIRRDSQKKYEKVEFKKASEKSGVKENKGLFNKLVGKINNIRKKLLEGRIERKNDTKAMFTLAKMYADGKIGIFKNVDKAIEYYSMAVSQGDEVQAEFELGKIYLYGKDNIEKDIAKAVFYYLNSAQKGIRESYEEVGNFYYNGIVVEKDYKKAQYYYEKALDKNWIEFFLEKRIPSFIYYRLGEIYKEVYKEAGYDEAKKYYKKGKAKGDIDSISALATLYENGLGVPCSRKEAIKLYRKAIKKGDNSAFVKIGKIYEYGVNSNPDYRSALYWFKEAEKKGELEGKLDIAELYEKGDYGINKDLKKAKEIYKALEQMNIHELVKLGDLFYYGIRREKNYFKARRWYEKAYQSKGYCSIKLGNTYFEDGSKSKIDIKKAKKYYLKSLEEGDIYGAYKLGKVHEYEGNYEEAIKYYEKAGAGEAKIAYLRLGEIFREGREGKNKIEKNYVESIKYYKLIGSYGNDAALEWVAKLYKEGGNGLEKDYKKSIEYYKKIEEKDGTIFMNLGELFTKADYEGRDYAKAKDYYEQACYENNQLALSALGDLYREGGPGLEKDFCLAKECYLRSFRINQYVSGKKFLEVVKTTGLTIDEFNEVKEYFLRENTKYSIKCLGDLYRYGYGTGKSYGKAAKYYEKALRMNG